MMETIAESRSTSPFLALPRELRGLIYADVLEDANEAPEFPQGPELVMQLYNLRIQTTGIFIHST